MRLLYFGTPEIAVPFLQDACASHEVLAVVTRADKPVGRGQQLTAPPVKRVALELGLKVLQPNKPSEIAPELKELGADLAVTCAYGRILKPDVLTAPKLGCVNVHFSLLPKYRGAAPMEWSLINGETESGVTIFWMDEGMDTGPMILKKAVAIGEDDDAFALEAKLVKAGREALKEALALIASGKAPREPQTGEPSLAPMLKKEHGDVSWDMPAKAIHDRVRGLRGWPRARFRAAGKTVQLLKTRVEKTQASASQNGAPGTVLRIESSDGYLIQCGDRALWVLEVQPEGRSPMAGASFLHGGRVKAGDVLR